MRVRTHCMRVADSHRIIRATRLTRRSTKRKSAIQIRHIERSGPIAATIRNTNSSKQIWIGSTRISGPITSKPSSRRGNIRTIHSNKPGRQSATQLSNIHSIISRNTTRNVSDLMRPHRHLTRERARAVTVNSITINKLNNIREVAVDFRSHRRSERRKRVGNRYYSHRKILFLKIITLTHLFPAERHSNRINPPTTNVVSR